MKKVILLIVLVGLTFMGCSGGVSSGEGSGDELSGTSGGTGGGSSGGGTSQGGGSGTGGSSGTEEDIDVVINKVLQIGNEEHSFKLLINNRSKYYIDLVLFDFKVDETCVPNYTNYYSGRYSWSSYRDQLVSPNTKKEKLVSGHFSLTSEKITYIKTNPGNPTIWLDVMVKKEKNSNSGSRTQKELSLENVLLFMDSINNNTVLILDIDNDIATQITTKVALDLRKE